MAKIISIDTNVTGAVGKIPRGFWSAGVYNAGDADAVFNGITLPAGLSVNLPKVIDEYSEDVSYNALTSRLLINYVL